MTVNGSLFANSINTSSTIQSNGVAVLTTDYNPFFCAGRVTVVSGVATATTSTGRIGYTIARSSAGVFTVNYNSAYPTSNYIPSVIAYGTYASCMVGSSTSAALLQVITFTGSSTNYDSNFFFTVF